MKGNRKRNIIVVLLYIFCFHSTAHSQSEDSTLKRLTQLRNDFVNEIIKEGFTPSLKPPEIIIDTPASFATFGNYDDSTNTIHTTGGWKTLPKSLQEFFNIPVSRIQNGETGESFFEKSIHRWIFMHELGHWWRSCQHQKATSYNEEKAADRIAIAY